MNIKIMNNPELKDVKVSVITPVYNVEEYIAETLDSLVSQSLQNIEIIMIDDGSSDRSPEIIREYANKYSNIVFAIQENSGPGAARNNGLQIARGEFISFVDSDDILPQDSLESMYAAALEEEADIITGASLSFNSKETWYIASHFDRGVYKPGSKSLIRNPELLYSLGPCNKLYRASMVKKIRFPKGIKVTEDHPFVIEAYLRAKKLFTIDKVIYNYRSREAETNLSLSQIVRVDSTSVLEDIFRSISISDNLWDLYLENDYARKALKTNYYNRIVRADIWPALNNAIRNKDYEAQEKCFKLFLNWVNALDQDLFNNVPILHRIMTYEIVDRYTYLSDKAKGLHLEWLKVCYAKLDPGSYHALDTSKKSAEVKAATKAYKANNTIPITTFLAKRKLKKTRKQWKTKINTAIARRIVFPIAKLLPIKKKITFASNKFGLLKDSFALIYDEIAKERPDYQVRGHFRRKRSFKDFCKLYYDLATSRYVILDDYYRPLYNMKCRKGTDVIQTWHACGAFKKFGFSAIGYNESNTKDFERKAHQSYTKVVVTSEEVVPHYAEAFDVPKNNVYPLGLARTDLFFDKDFIQFIREKYRGTYPNIKDKKIITYAPTFRGGPGVRANFKIELDLSRMAKELGDEYVLFLKLHPSVTKQIKIPEDAQDFVLNVSKNDITNVLIMTDILISDYSSLVFEYALLERPMIFYAYDLETYLEDRGFYYDYKSFVPGKIAVTSDEVINQIREKTFDFEKVAKFKEQFFDHLDGKSAQRFVETLIEK